MDWDWKRIASEAIGKGDIGEILRACFHEGGHARLAYEADHTCVIEMILSRHKMGVGHTDVDERRLRKTTKCAHVAVAGILAEAKASAGGPSGRYPLARDQRYLHEALVYWQETGVFRGDQPPEHKGAWLRISVDHEVDETSATITDDDAVRIPDEEWDPTHLRNAIVETCELLNNPEVWAGVQALATTLSIKGALSGAAVLRIIKTGR